MRGSLRRRYRHSWSLILDLGYQVDPVTGRLKRKQRWITFHGPRKAAEAKLTDLLRAIDRGEFVEPSKLTVGEWVDEWVEKAIKPPLRAQATYDGYRRIIEKHIRPALGSIRLQALKPIDLERYYVGLSALAGATIQVHHALIHSALKAALLAGLVSRNVATLVTNKPRKGPTQDTLDHVWTAGEAAKFLGVAKQAGPQPAAFYSLALDTGARRGELAALRWADLDFGTGRLRIQRHLVKGGLNPIFGPTKTKTSRVVELADETLALLKAHKAHQAELKLKNRRHYRDHGLIFAKEWGELHGRAESLGGPLQVNNIGVREFNRLIEKAGVKRIKFHGLRHTVATLMLAANVPAHVVQRRLGHSKIEMTLGIYAHALPSMQADAAKRLAALLHG